MSGSKIHPLHRQYLSFFHVFLVFPCVVKVKPGRNQWTCWYVMSSVEFQPIGELVIQVGIENSPPAQARFDGFSCVSSVPLCGEGETRSELVDMLVCHVISPTANHVDSCLTDLGNSSGSLPITMQSKFKCPLNARLTNKKVTKMALPPQRPAQRQYHEIGTIECCPSSDFPSRTSLDTCICWKGNTFSHFSGPMNHVTVRLTR